MIKVCSLLDALKLLCHLDLRSLCGPALLPCDNASPLYLSLISWNIRMLKVFHPHPGNCHPHPSHDTRKNDQRRIIPHDWECRIVFQLGRRVRCLAYIPSPTPNVETAAHSHNEKNPRHDKDDPSPPTRLRIVPFRRRWRGNSRRKRGEWG